MGGVPTTVSLWSAWWWEVGTWRKGTPLWDTHSRTRKARGMHFSVQGWENTLHYYRRMCPGDVCLGSAGVVFLSHSHFLLLSFCCGRESPISAALQPHAHPRSMTLATSDVLHEPLWGAGLAWGRLQYCSGHQWGSSGRCSGCPPNN